MRSLRIYEGVIIYLITNKQRWIKSGCPFVIIAQQDTFPKRRLMSRQTVGPRKLHIVNIQLFKEIYLSIKAAEKITLFQLVFHDQQT